MKTAVTRAQNDRKIIFLIWCLRFLSLAFAVWSLVKINQWWGDSVSVTKYMGLALKRDLSAHQDWQRYLPWAIDWLVWGLLALAVWRGWLMLGRVLSGQTFTPRTAELLNQVGMLGLSSQLFAMVTRPLYSWLLTYHLSSDQRVVRWRIQESDLLVLLLCGVLICTAIIVKRGTAIAQENEGFV